MNQSLKYTDAYMAQEGISNLICIIWTPHQDIKENTETYENPN